ncbi:MAG: HEPN domain-containing protein [Rhodocyclales bacterium]|nr:HEPN domain-containing protein [Rhodocyclales bacterium]
MNSASDFGRLLLEKARDDAYAFQRLADDPRAPSWILGFHAQQSVEKALKSVLASRRIEYPRTHNLAMLVELLSRKAFPCRRRPMSCRT